MDTCHQSEDLRSPTCGPVCGLHLTPWDHDIGCATGAVLAQVEAKHVEQYAQYGAVNEDMPDGTGPEVEWLDPVVDETLTQIGHGGYREVHLTATEIEAVFRREWDYPKDDAAGQAAAMESASWMRLFREEVAEAFGEEDWDALDEELTQAAGIIVGWRATIMRRRARVARELRRLAANEPWPS
jgi:hypothetical protein